jgi:hypothetical protein
MLNLKLFQFHLHQQFTDNPYYVFPEMKLRSLVPIAYIHVSVSDVYIPMIDRLIWLQQNRQTNPPGNINRSQIHECQLQIGRQNIIILFWK